MAKTKNTKKIAKTKEIVNSYEFSFITINTFNNQDFVLNALEFNKRINIQSENLNTKVKHYEKLIEDLDKEIKNYKIYKIIQNRSIFENKHFVLFYDDLDDYINCYPEGLINEFDDFIEWVKDCIKGVVRDGIYYPDMIETYTNRYKESDILISVEALTLFELEIINTLDNLKEFKVKINEKLLILKNYLYYKSQNDELNFDNFILEPMPAIEFSRYIEKQDIKLLYLKYIHTVFEDKPFKNTEYLKAEIKKIEDYIRLKNEKAYSIPEKSIPEQKQEIKPLNKFTFNNDITEENIVLLFNLLNQAGFISDKDFSNLGKILQDTFLNSRGKPFVNTQINKVKITALSTKSLTEKKNLNLLKLSRELKRLIQD